MDPTAAVAAAAENAGERSREVTAAVVVCRGCCGRPRRSLDNSSPLSQNLQESPEFGHEEGEAEESLFRTANRPKRTKVDE